MADEDKKLLKDVILFLFLSSTWPVWVFMLVKMLTNLSVFAVSSPQTLSIHPLSDPL